MIARKNPSTGKWDAQYSYTDWQGKRKKTTKRGFRTKREAVEWYDHFRATQDADFNMVFKDFIEIYMEDQSHRLRQHTMMNKRFLIDKHIIPYRFTILPVLLTIPVFLLLGWLIPCLMYDNAAKCSVVEQLRDAQ